MRSEISLYLKQGGSVVCNRIQVFDPAHPQIWHNCLPNEEQIEKHKNYFWESQKIQKTQRKPKENPNIFQKNSV